LAQLLENLHTHTGNDGKQDLLIIDTETGLLSHPSTLECVSPNSGIKKTSLLYRRNVMINTVIQKFKEGDLS
jgi:hypothetical protein